MKLHLSIQQLVIGSLLLVSTIAAIPSNAKVSETETSLICDIARDGMAEVKLGEIAQQRAKSQEVKDFAKHMVKDHSKANDELKQAAQKDGVSLPTNLNAKQQQTADNLRALSEDAFDKQYMAEMKKDHDKAIAALTKEANSGTGNLKAWAEKTLPVVKEHAREIKTINQTQ